MYRGHSNLFTVKMEIESVGMKKFKLNICAEFCDRHLMKIRKSFLICFVFHIFMLFIDDGDRYCKISSKSNGLSIII